MKKKIVVVKSGAAKRTMIKSIAKLKGGDVLSLDLNQVAEHEYYAYGVSVIEDRAIFSGIDGLKPVARRSLYAINELGLNSGAKADKSAKAVGHCYAKGTTITMADGCLKCIENVQVGEKVKTRNGDRKVTNTFYNGVRETIRLEASNGKMLTLTPEELVWALCPDGEQRWVAAADLTLEHALAVD